MIMICPDRVPDPDGTKETLRGQLAPTARDATHPLLKVKSPETEIEFNVTAFDPTFVTMPVCGALAVVTTCGP